MLFETNDKFCCTASGVPFAGLAGALAAGFAVAGVVGADFFFDAAEGPFLAFCGFRLFRYFCHASLSSFSSFPGELTPSFGRPSAVKSSC